MKPCRAGRKPLKTRRLCALTQRRRERREPRRGENHILRISASLQCKPNAFKVDTQGVLFHTIGPRSPELVVQNTRLVNPATDNAPSFVHGPNHGDLSNVEQWLAQN